MYHILLLLILTTCDDECIVSMKKKFKITYIHTFIHISNYARIYYTLYITYLNMTRTKKYLCKKQ